MGHAVRTPVFEGPLDLLVHLVNTHEVDVVEVPLAPIVDGFVAALHAMHEVVDLDALSEFLLFAAILVELKSQRLLPGPDEPLTDEEIDAWEERDLLVSRLLECQAYAAASHALARLAELASLSLPREAGLDPEFVVHAPDLLEGVTPSQLAVAFVAASAAVPVPRVDLSHVTVDALSVSETVGDLVAALPVRGRVTFAHLTAHLERRLDVIVHFLAVLELCKLGHVELGQGERFGDLEIVWVAADPVVVGVALGGVDDYEG
jgi:segregation and condensation protein A